MEVSAASSVSMAQANVQSQVAVSMLKKTLDISAEQGADLAKMMSQTSGVGTRVDQFA